MQYYVRFVMHDFNERGQKGWGLDSLASFQPERSDNEKDYGE